ncbi:MAG: CotH kinase family protein [Thiobacillus sp.]|nr:CotH kinase family protein [Thiobacillus sp.]MDP2979813.1 CotH kinase family protein [Thiobacillus sp.]
MKKHSLNKLLITFLIGVTLTQGAQAESTQTAPAKPHSGLNKDGHIHAPARHWPADATVAAQAAAVREVPPSSEPGIQPPVVSPPAADYGLAGGTPVASSEIHLEMDARDAEVLFRKEPFDKSAFPVRLKIGNGLVAGEIAVKGSFSRRYLKKSLLITLPKGQTWQGHRRIALNAMATDPTQAREWLAWDLARALGMHIPRTGYKKLYLNGRYIGLYFDIEWMDDVMFDRLGLGHGEFYQPDDSTFCGDFMPANVSRTAFCWKKIFPQGGDMSALTNLAKALNDTPVENFDTWLDEHFDAQSVIDWLVINTLTQNGDTYNKNYFLHYAPAEQKWRVIPWDYDLSWGRVADNAQAFPKNIHNEFFQYLYPPVVGAENPLKTKMLKNPRLYARFQARLKEVLTPGDTPASGWYEPTGFQRRLADIKALVEPLLAHEAYPAQQPGAASAHFDALAFFNEWRYHTLKGLLLDPSPFDTPRWLPYTSYTPLTPLTPESLKQRRTQPMDLMANEVLAAHGEKTPFMEKLLAYPLAFATLREGQAPVRLTVETDRETPPSSLPPGKSASQCIERTWFVTLKSEQPARVDLQFDYLQESSTRHELGSAIKDESRLTLWRHDGKTWQQTRAAVNPVANYFNIAAQPLVPGILNRYVACQEN